MFKKITPLFILFILPYFLSANTYYVSNTGNNSNNGLSLALAFLTLQKAASVVIAGDSVIVANGSYVGFDIRTSGNSADPIVFFASGTEVIINTRNTVTPDGINIENANWIEIRGFRIINQPRAGIRAVLADHISVRYNTCLNNNTWGIFTGFTDDFLAEYNECAFSVQEHGIYVSNSSDRAILRYNISHHNRAAGFHFNGDVSQGEDGINHDPQVYGNIIYRNGRGGGSAINMDGNQNALIYNNLLYDNYATGIGLYQIDGGSPSYNAKIYHNTIVQDDTSRWCILIIDGSTGATIRNNILINQHSFRGSISIDLASMTGFTSDYNIMTNRFTTDDGDSILDSVGWKALGKDQHSFFAPSFANLFVNVAGADYKLGTNSKARNFGIGGLNPAILTDLLGNVRPNGPAPDAGAYEAISAALSLKWISTKIRQKNNHVEITGSLYSDEQIKKIWLEEWNIIDNTFENLDSKSIVMNGLSSQLTFNIPTSNGFHIYRLNAESITGEKFPSPTVSMAKNTGAWTLFPNPASDMLNFKGLPKDEIIQGTIIDLQGKRIKTSKDLNVPFDIHDLPSGQYRILLHQGNHQFGQTTFQKIQD